MWKNSKSSCKQRTEIVVALLLQNESFWCMAISRLKSQFHIFRDNNQRLYKKWPESQLSFLPDESTLINESHSSNEFFSRSSSGVHFIEKRFFFARSTLKPIWSMHPCVKCFRNRFPALFVLLCCQKFFKLIFLLFVIFFPHRSSHVDNVSLMIMLNCRIDIRSTEGTF